MNIELFQLIEQTNRSIFLTGKAGTGKTTFLNDFVNRTKKKFIVLAPTGIAAINAGGVTIHSMFGLPLRTFIPTTERIDQNLGNNIFDLKTHFRFRREKIKLLREVEIIIIDEVSMLRSDVLDMVDYALQYIRRNQLKFGGIQMLFIGDLYQLPPVIKDEETMMKYYNSPFFFSAKALEDIDLITIELTKVYRQTDENFVKILNAIRDGDINKIDFNTLNSRYQPDFEPQKDQYVYLTSHNRMADDVNNEKLNQLSTKSHFFKAKITGDFKESQYPNDEILELKVGAQIMFIRNDPSAEKKYFNGKLAEIVHIDPMNDNIYVKLEGQDDSFLLKKEIWENKKYSLGNDKKIVEEVMGSFEQYPIRLAWAVTIHKSQGLTFDRLIIDAGQSFVPGQVYVALSRCRTLEGIVLKSKITPGIILQDKRVAGFQKETNANEKINEILETEKYDFAIMKMLQKINCIWLINDIQNWYQAASETKKIDYVKVNELFLSTKSEIEKLNDVFKKFEKFVKQKAKLHVETGNHWDEIVNKSKGAVAFFYENILNKLFNPFKNFYAETKGIAGLKTYNKVAKTMLDDLQDYLQDLQNIYLLEQALFEKKNIKKINLNVAKIPSHMMTWQLFSDGKNISQIAKERGLLNATIFGHLTKFADSGVLEFDDLKRIIAKEKIDAFKEKYPQPQFQNLTDWKNALPSDFEFSEIRLLWTFFEKQSSKNSDDD